MDIWSRLSGQTLAKPVTDPMTGEILAMPGDVISRDKAHEISDRGVNEAIIDVDGREVKVFSNGMVDMAKFVDFDPKQYGIKEKVCFSVLREMLQTVPADGWEEAINERREDLIPKHITRTTFSHPSTICAPWCRARAQRTTLTIWAIAAFAAWASCCRTSSASALPA